MLVVTVTSLVGLVVIAWAVHRVDRAEDPAVVPDWEAIPVPSDLTQIDLPVTYPGYDPASVEAALDAMRQAYTDLYVAAPPEVIERARRRAALRQDPLDLR
jgi:hypothetical protein